MKPKARLNSDDIRGLGAGFEEIVAPSPPEIEIKLEIEDTVGQRNPSPLVQSPSHGNKLPLTNSSHPGASRQPDPVALEATLTHESLRTPERSSKGGSSRRSRNSWPGTITSEYLSTRAYHHSQTTADAIHDSNAGGLERLDRQPTPYFTPNHTPTHRSEETAEDVGVEEEDDGEEHIPQSPLPFSEYHYYNSGYGRGAVEHVERQMGQALRSDIWYDNAHDIDKK